MAEYTPEEKRLWKLRKWSDEALIEAVKRHSIFLEALKQIIEERGIKEK